jgi:hypothetical protein
VKTRHVKTLEAVYMKPTSGGVLFADLEALLVALGGQIREGAGSRVAFEIKGTRIYLHRRHPGKEAKKYQVEDLRAWFIQQGVTP